MSRNQNWGAVSITDDAIDFRSTLDATNALLFKVPLNAIRSVAGNKTEVAVQLKAEHATTGPIVLQSIRFAVPTTCVGYEQTEEAAKDMRQAITNAMQSAGFADRSEVVVSTDIGTPVAVFEDLSVSQPSGKYQVTIGKRGIQFFDNKKKAAFFVMHSHIANFFLVDIPGADAQYFVACLDTKLRIGSTDFSCVVFAFPNHVVLSDEHAWKMELKTEADIVAQLGEEAAKLVQPAMSGRMSEIVAAVMKAASGKPVIGGINKEFSSVLDPSTCALRCSHKGTEGLLYVLTNNLLFLHRPAVRIKYKSITKVELDESASGLSTFTVQVLLDSGEKLNFAALDKKEQRPLLQYLASKATVSVKGAMDLLEDDEDDEEDDDEDYDEEDDEEESDDDDDFDSESDGSDAPAKKKSKTESGKKEKKHKKDKKDKKHKKEKKHKKDKKDKKDKKNKKEKKEKKG